MNSISVATVEEFLRYRKQKNSRTVCCSKNPFIRNEGPTTEISSIDYNGHLPRELPNLCCVAIGDVRVFIKHLDFFSEICIKTNISKYISQNSHHSAKKKKNLYKTDTQKLINTEVSSNEVT
jgi:hypothetical protein